jgi:hypothetical protein
MYIFIIDNAQNAYLTLESRKYMASAEGKLNGGITDPNQLKEEGNERFRLGDLAAALQAYNEAFLLLTATNGSEDHQSLRLALYKNRALARLRLEDHEGAEADCDRGEK